MNRKRIAVFAYGVVAYAIFFGTFLYAVGFIGNFGMPKTIDSDPTQPLGVALAVNAALLGLFAVQHSVMARRTFKDWIARHVPPAAERSTYVLASSLALILLFALWQPIGGTVWSVEHPAARAALYTIYGLGWLQVLVTTFLINHFDLFGLRQVWFYLRGREYKQLKFVTPGPYKHVRHPLYIGWLMVFWATPTMTAAHLLFAVLTTAYILVGIQLEECDLVRYHGADYAEYKRRVPMLIPRLIGKPAAGRKIAEADSSAA